MENLVTVLYYRLTKNMEWSKLTQTAMPQTYIREVFSSTLSRTPVILSENFRDYF